MASRCGGLLPKCEGMASRAGLSAGCSWEDHRVLFPRGKALREAYEALLKVL